MSTTCHLVDIRMSSVFLLLFYLVFSIFIGDHIEVLPSSDVPHRPHMHARSIARDRPHSRGWEGQRSHLVDWMGHLAFSFCLRRKNTHLWWIIFKLYLHLTLPFFTMQGVICSGVAYYVSGVIMKEKGPVFVTSFNPLNMVIVAGMSSFILSEQLNVGKYVFQFS